MQRLWHSRAAPNHCNAVQGGKRGRVGGDAYACKEWRGRWRRGDALPLLLWPNTLNPASLFQSQVLLRATQGEQRKQAEGAQKRQGLVPARHRGADRCSSSGWPQMRQIHASGTVQSQCSPSMPTWTSRMGTRSLAFAIAALDAA